MHIFEKLPQILGLCPIVKLLSTLEKSDPPNILWTPLNRKILHKLLFLGVIIIDIFLRIFQKNLKSEFLIEIFLWSFQTLRKYNLRCSCFLPTSCWIEPIASIMVLNYYIGIDHKYLINLLNWQLRLGNIEYFVAICT